ncbi:MAG TPA: hypothetical protein VKB65_01545 [Myxococcota bacterium]|nr:hypothetical protein [Myxococcota bacterium]
MNTSHRRSFAPFVAAMALLASMAMTVGCYYPYHHGHGGWYAYDDHRGHHDRDRRDHDGDRRHRDRRGDRRGH